MKILLGIPTGGSPAEPFLQSLASLHLPAAIFDRYVVQGNFVPAQRELISQRALENDADVLVMCDDDMVLPPNALLELVGILDRDRSCGLAGALYYSRDGFRPMVVNRWDARDTTAATIPAFDDRTPVRVDGIGFGCVAIRVDALRTLVPPFFPTHVFIERAAARVRVCNEDYLFCSLLRGAGWHVVLHPGVRAGHFNRATGTTAPQAWEDAQITNRERMVVATAGGLPQLVSYDPALGRGAERHELSRIEYLFVD